MLCKYMYTYTYMYIDDSRCCHFLLHAHVLMHSML